MQDSTEVNLQQLTERLAAAVAAIEQALPTIAAAAAQPVGAIVATVETGREAELAQRLADAEKTIAELRASAESGHESRRTVPTGLMARHDGATAEPGALDAALTSLSLEQRIAVKSQLLRAGIL